MLIYRSSLKGMHVHDTWQSMQQKANHAQSKHQILGSCMSRIHDNDQVSSAIKKAIIQVAGDRDMATQETAHMLLSMPLTGCTYSFVTVSLDNSRKVVIDNENQSDEVLQKSTIEEYGKRSTANSRCQGLSQLNLMQYVSQYTTY